MSSTSVTHTSGSDRPRFWTTVLLITVAPLTIVLCLTLWQMPFPVSEAVALFEDVAKRPVSTFLIPETSYYRPLFHVTLSTIWHHAGSLDARLDWIRLLHIVPIALLMLMFVLHVRPRTALEFAAAAVAVAVVLGSPGIRDNLELPLSYTIVGVPLALATWIIANREWRRWHGPAIVLLTLIAIGFKEQGLVLIPLVVVAWLTRAPGVGRPIVALLTIIAIAYVAMRLEWRGKWPMFEQAIGFGFHEYEPPQAVARFGAFPYGIYAYNSLSTIMNVLFAEPTRGVFSITWMLTQRNIEPWQEIHLISSTLLTIVIGWWGVRSLRQAITEGWSIEPRAFVALIVVLLACGALSFDYSRDRLGGMAVAFYALAAFFALRAAMIRFVAGRGVRFVAAAVVLTAVAAMWEIRALATIEWVRLTSARNQMEWLTLLPARRVEFADRKTYLEIMQSMMSQGTDPAAPAPTRVGERVARTLGVPMLP